MDAAERASRTSRTPYPTKFKLLYSKKGLYVLMDAVDKKLTATFKKDFENLWTEDVFEVFLWTDERDTVYFEYEISPLNYELPIIIPNFEGTFLGWLPWHYDGDRKIQKAVSVTGGKQESGAAVEGWRAEFMIPYDLLRPLRNAVPTKGTKWRANFYRMDHDLGKDQTVQWDWSRVEQELPRLPQLRHAHLRVSSLEVTFSRRNQRLRNTSLVNHRFARSDLRDRDDRASRHARTDRTGGGAVAKV